MVDQYPRDLIAEMTTVIRRVVETKSKEVHPTESVAQPGLETTNVLDAAVTSTGTFPAASSRALFEWNPPQAETSSDALNSIAVDELQPTRQGTSALDVRGYNIPSADASMSLLPHAPREQQQETLRAPTQGASAWSPFEDFLVDQNMLGHGMMEPVYVPQTLPGVASGYNPYSTPQPPVHGYGHTISELGLSSFPASHMPSQAYDFAGGGYPQARLQEMASGETIARWAAELSDPE
jgi:hypothetical protein